MEGTSTLHSWCRRMLRCVTFKHVLSHITCCIQILLHGRYIVNYIYYRVDARGCYVDMLLSNMCTVTHNVSSFSISLTWYLYSRFPSMAFCLATEIWAELQSTPITFEKRGARSTVNCPVPQPTSTARDCGSCKVRNFYMKYNAKLCNDTALMIIWKQQNLHYTTWAIVFHLLLQNISIYSFAWRLSLVVNPYW